MQYTYSFWIYMHTCSAVIYYMTYYAFSWVPCRGYIPLRHGRWHMDTVQSIRHVMIMFPSRKLWHTCWKYFWDLDWGVIIAWVIISPATLQKCQGRHHLHYFEWKHAQKQNICGAQNYRHNIKHKIRKCYCAQFVWIIVFVFQLCFVVEKCLTSFICIFLHGVACSALTLAVCRTSVNVLLQNRVFHLHSQETRLWWYLVWCVVWGTAMIRETQRSNLVWVTKIERLCRLWLCTHTQNTHTHNTLQGYPTQARRDPNGRVWANISKVCSGLGRAQTHWVHISAITLDIRYLKYWWFKSI